MDVDEDLQPDEKEGSVPDGNGNGNGDDEDDDDDDDGDDDDGFVAPPPLRTSAPAKATIESEARPAALGCAAGAPQVPIKGAPAIRTYGQPQAAKTPEVPKTTPKTNGKPKPKPKSKRRR